MLDVYEYKEGTYEVVDTQHQELRAKRYMYRRMIRFVIILLIILIITFVFVAFATGSFVWLLVIILPIGFIVIGYKSIKRLEVHLKPEISSIILEYDKSKTIVDFRIRKWTENKIDEFIEEKVRFNQAIGFKVIWFDDGKFHFEIIVDKEFPGNLIFTTFDFFVVIEFKKLFSIATPKLDTWVFQLEDGSNWSEESLEELENEVEATKIPWAVREYFKEL